MFFSIHLPVFGIISDTMVAGFTFFCFLDVLFFNLVVGSFPEKLLKTYNCVPVFRAGDMIAAANEIITKPGIIFSNDKNLMEILRVFRYWKPCHITSEKESVVNPSLLEHKLQRKPINIIVTNNTTLSSAGTPMQTTLMREVTPKLWSIQVKCFKEKHLTNYDDISDIHCPSHYEGQRFTYAVVGHAPYLITSK